MLLKSPFTPKTNPLPAMDTPLHGDFTISDLPKEYLEFLEKFGIGYLDHTRVPTTEPTRDGLDSVALFGICGFEPVPRFPSIQDFTPDVTGLPDYFIVFYVEDDRYFCFDYSTKGEPSIRYIDQECDQWLTLAPSFKDLIEKLEPDPNILPLEEDYEWMSVSQTESIFSRLEQPFRVDIVFNDAVDLIPEEEILLWLLFYKLEGGEMETFVQELLDFHLEYRMDIVQDSLAALIHYLDYVNVDLKTILEDFINDIKNGK